MRPLLVLTLLMYASGADGATLLVEVRNAKGAAVGDAVVYAIPEGGRLPPAKGTAVMDQVNRMFVPHVLPIQTGTAVSFPNSDDIHHQIYSFSPVKPFSLPLYKGTPPKAVVFDRAGVVSLGCNIHDRMSAYIVIVDTPHFAVTTSKGNAQLSELRQGGYSVHVWYPGSGSKTMKPIAVSLDGTEREHVAFVVGK